jgi:hypothetical protein
MMSFTGMKGLNAIEEDNAKGQDVSRQKPDTDSTSIFETNHGIPEISMDPTTHPTGNHFFLADETDPAPFSSRNFSDLSLKTL